MRQVDPRAGWVKLYDKQSYLVSGYNSTPAYWTVHRGIHSSSKIMVLSAVWTFILVERSGSTQVQNFMYFSNFIFMFNFLQLEQT